VLSTLLGELAEMFPDEVLNIGSDETKVLGPCSLANTKSLEAKVLHFVENTLKKRAMGWVNVWSTTHAATQRTILDTWATVYGMPDVVTAAGFQCVASTYMYLNHVSGPVGAYTMYWRDIAPNVTEIAKKLMLGGEVSMWTDDYCWTNQCGASAGPTPQAASMYSPRSDATFASSIAGVMFPRAAVGAGSFWNYVAGLDGQSSTFLELMHVHNSRMMARGLDTCPNDCNCDVLTRCGRPYSRTDPP
jgi:hypothetical protein